MGKTKTALVNEPQEKKKEDKKAEKVHIGGLKGGQRIKVVEATPIVVEETKAEAPRTKKTKKQRVRSKKYQEAKAKIDRNKFYELKEAVDLVKGASYSKFDGTMELHLVVKKTGLSANVTLPHSAGKEKKVEVASEATVEKLKTGKIDFDVLLATAEMMPKLVPFAKLLGPKGLMPNPKNGTLIKSAKEAGKFGGNTLSLKTEKEAPVVHTTVGRVSQTEKELVENISAVLGAFPKQVVKAYLKSTMSPSAKLVI